MYRRLKSEIAFQGSNMKELSEKTGIPYSSLVRKINKRQLLLSDALEIKKALKTEMPLEDLFEWFE